MKFFQSDKISEAINNKLPKYSEASFFQSAKMLKLTLACITSEAIPINSEASYF